MTDSVLVQNGRVQQIWRGKRKADLRPMSPSIMAAIVETDADAASEGDAWDGAAFTPAAPPAAIVSYADFRARWTDDEKAALHTACAASWQIDDFVGLARAQNTINLSGPVAAAAKAALVAANVLTAERAEVVFAR